MMPRASTLTWVLVALAAAALVAYSLVFNFVTDDAFISFVYARNLAHHGQLVFNLGERVEGYTNFLWTVLLAALLKLGLAPEVTSRVLGTAFGAATLAVCARASRRLRGSEAYTAWDALPALLLAGVPGYACWSSGGLETQMFTFFVTVGATTYLCDPERATVPVAFALAALTRPEGVLLFAATALHRLLARRRWPTRRELALAALFAAIVVPHLVWRRWYYGWWLPNTFYIKSSGGPGTWAQGTYYLRQFAAQFHLWVAPVLVVAGLARRREAGALALFGYTLWVAAIFGVYVASVGGDFMGLFRFALPVLPLIALSAAAGLRLLVGGVAAPLAVGAAALLLVAHGLHAREVTRRSFAIGADRGIDTPGFLRWYTADRAAIGRWFGRYAQPDDYAAVGGAGAQVYYSGIRSLDCFGLSDAYIAHRVPPQSNRPGHQKYAPLDYQLAGKPTIITSNYYHIDRAPYRPSPFEAADWHRRGYHYVSVQIEGLSSPWYSFLLRDDRRLGPVGPGAEAYEDGWQP
jgi:hypothetical protein